MIPDDLVHGICRIVLRAGVPTPSLATKHDAVAAPTAAVLHVFRTDAEAAAFVAGIAILPSNDLRAVRGVDGAEPIVLVSRAGSSDQEVLAVHDHGGLKAAKAQALWHDLARAMPEGFAIEFGRDGAHPTFVVGGGRRFGLSLYEGWIQLTTRFRANNRKVETSLACGFLPSDILYCCVDKVLKIEMEQSLLIDRLPSIARIEECLTREESQDVANIHREAVRQDPKHCAIVEKMISGWTLSSVHGSVSLAPPDVRSNPGARLTPVTRAVVSNLEDAGLIRRPRWVRDRSWEVNFHFEVGGTFGSAVREAKKAS